MPVKCLRAKKRLCSNLRQLKTLLPQVTNTWLIVGSLLDLRSRAWLPLNSLCTSSFCFFLIISLPWPPPPYFGFFREKWCALVRNGREGTLGRVDNGKRCTIKACRCSRLPAIYMLNVKVRHLIVLNARPWSSLLLWESNAELLGEAQILPCSSSH